MHTPNFCPVGGLRNFFAYIDAHVQVSGFDA